MSKMSIPTLLALLLLATPLLTAQDLRFQPCPYPRSFGAPCLPPEDEEEPPAEETPGQPAKPAAAPPLFSRDSVAKDTPELLLTIVNRQPFTFTDAELDQLIAQEAEKKRRMQVFQQALIQRLKTRKAAQ